MEQQSWECSDCGLDLSLDLGESPSELIVKMASMVKCDTCATLRRDFKKHNAVATKAIRTAEEMSWKIKNITKIKESTLTPHQKEDLWVNKDKMAMNLSIHRKHAQKAKMANLWFKTRTGLTLS